MVYERPANELDKAGMTIRESKDPIDYIRLKFIPKRSHRCLNQ